MKNKDYKWIYLTIVLIAFDQIIKNIIFFKFPDLFTLNKGILFGYIENIYMVIIFLIIGVIILGYIFSKSKNIDVSLALVLSGALSNIIDRFLHKGVIDYIHLSFWSDFNLADIYIVLGVMLYIYKTLYTNNRKSF